MDIEGYSNSRSASIVEITYPQPKIRNVVPQQIEKGNITTHFFQFLELQHEGNAQQFASDVL
jgi:hypothetical protein